MELTDIGWGVAYVALIVAMYVFIFRGRKLGYKGLAARTTELRQQGVGTVYLLRSNKSVGYTSRRANVWDLLNTGYLAYVRQGALVIEFPWWHRVREMAVATPADSEGHFTTSSATIWRKVPGIQFGEWNFSVVGVNVADPLTARRAIARKDLTTQQIEAFRSQFAAELSQAGFRIYSN